jgi:sporulation protein YlmC with PRC-barrel domain
MKKVAVLMLASSVLTLAAVSDGVAQQRPATGAAPAKDTWSAREAWRNAEGLYETKKIIGTRVKGADGKDLGEIDQLLIDPKDGKIAHAVIGLGGFAGIGERHVVVKWSDVKLSADAKNPDRMVVTMDQGALDRAPRYERRTATSDRMAPAASPATAPRMEPKPAEPKNEPKK